MSKLIFLRKRNGAICFKCKSPDYKEELPWEECQTKPRYQCNSCGNTWQFGKNGGVYSQFLNLSTDI